MFIKYYIVIFKFEEFCLFKIFYRLILFERYIIFYMDIWKIFMVIICIKNLKCLFF